MEDATYTLLQDFVDSLANLPSEVGHLLCEIAYLDYAKKSAKDDQPPVSQAGNGESGLNKKWYSVDESRRKAASKQSSIARHSHKPPNNLLTPNPKEPVLIERALAHYDDAINLSKEKEKFASGAVNLVTRHLERLNQELVKLAATTGVEVPEFKREPSEPPLAPGSLRALSNGLSNAVGTPVAGFEATCNNKRKQLLTDTPPPHNFNPTQLPGVGSSLPASGQANKRRAGQARQTLRIHMPSMQPKEAEEVAAMEYGPGDEAEGDEGEDSNAGDDTTLYCFCQKVSYGEMIGCDNKTCRYEWFHVSCLGLKETPIGKWYCPQCTAEGKGQKFLHTGRQRKRA
ncbi:hypothetical protein MJO28_006237 [Puccinia striiformis f. sp. tritici]|uniref:Chromatin modification-related protein n=2 Tax=Puccinia striiformis TaxID=27350 RepID=A0A2S4UIQ3_9BASI|nr:hypothetical protein MJO28_006237 [Puccinia striiformis f. sp. tritici]POV97203.1 hypothetical protein PSTT_15175 [Puccinia striiformis]